MTDTRLRKTDYTIRVSQRAKRVILKVSGLNGLEVVVPRGFNTKRLPEILKANENWITNQLQSAKQSSSLTAPEQIELRAIDQRWQVETQPGVDSRFLLWEGPSMVIEVQGDVGDVHGLALVLNRWLHVKARAHLVPWLGEVSRQVEIPFKKAAVRGQTTRWASCSALGNISLNRSLLFLPKYLVRHVLLHELCHIKELNHSPNFWRLLQKLEPDCRDLEHQVREAGQYVPQWVQWRERG